MSRIKNLRKMQIFISFIQNYKYMHNKSPGAIAKQLKISKKYMHYSFMTRTLHYQMIRYIYIYT